MRSHLPKIGSVLEALGQVTATEPSAPVGGETVTAPLVALLIWSKSMAKSSGFTSWPSRWASKRSCTSSAMRGVKRASGFESIARSRAVRARS